MTLCRYRTHWDMYPEGAFRTFFAMPSNQVREVHGLNFICFLWVIFMKNLWKQRANKEQTKNKQNLWLWVVFPWGVLTELRHFHPFQIKFCSMHSLNLGFALWLAGGVILYLSDIVNVWGPPERPANERFHDAWLQFNTWAKSKKMQ